MPVNPKKAVRENVIINSKTDKPNKKKVNIASFESAYKIMTMPFSVTAIVLYFGTDRNIISSSEEERNSTSKNLKNTGRMTGFQFLQPTKPFQIPEKFQFPATLQTSQSLPPQVPPTPKPPQIPPVQTSRE